jgi:hypothetical protein
MSENNGPEFEKGESPAAPQPPAGLSLKFILGCVALALVKLWMVGSDEIVARHLPHDDLWYVVSAKQWYWLGPYAEGSLGTPPFIRLPAYPLFIALAKQTGLPLRVSIEILLIVAAAVFAAAIAKAGQPRLLAVLLYVAIIFHPVSFQVNNYVGTDSFYAPILLLVLASMILLFLKRDDRRRRWYSLTAGGALAVLWQARQEGVVILGMLAVYGLLLLFVVGVRGRPARATLKQFGVVVIAPALVILAVSLALRGVNYFKFGVFAPDAMTMSGFEAACKALMRIRPSRSIRYAPVTREARQRAYLVSPAFRELEPYFEGEPGRDWQRFARELGLEAEDEISAGHIWWALNDAAYQAGYNKSAREANVYFQRVADEINAACDHGRLQCRWAFSSLLDPDIKKWAPYLPSSFRRLAASFFEAHSVAAEAEAATLSPEVSDLFDEVANRRKALVTSESAAYLGGWAFAPGYELQKVVLRDRAGRAITSNEHLAPRPDVAARYAAQGAAVSAVMGFRFRIPPSQGSEADLVFIASDGKEWVMPRVRKPADATSQEGLTYAVESDESVAASNRLASKSARMAARIQTYIGAEYGRVNLILTWVGLAALLTLLLCRAHVNPRENAYVIIIILAAGIFLRLALFAFIDASSYLIIGRRYVYPVMPLYTCSLLLLIAQTTRLVASRLNERGFLQKVDFRNLYKKKTSAEDN